ncbi:hypothetical protein lerEdw1_010021 [Lerista edwardsae]|nr:hypothetical protein lerEdw1_010021 [Lerista edwardsae]
MARQSRTDALAMNTGASPSSGRSVILVHVLFICFLDMAAQYTFQDAKLLLIPKHADISFIRMMTPQSHV